MPPFPEFPRCLSPFQGNMFSLHGLDFQAEDGLTPRWHVGQPCGKASWESLVGKPRGKASGKASRESHRSLDPPGLDPGIRPCVEAVPETEDSSPVLTWILGYFWSLPRGVSPRLEWGHARGFPPEL